jgi:PTH1 family peptidyl-tRNA hydrolase
MVLIVGLGNPGRKYENTRHNMGFWVLERLAGRLGAPEWRRHGEMLVSKGIRGPRKYLLAKPQTFMNNSGRPVAELLAYFKIPLEDSLAVVDDLELTPGLVRQRRAGSDGGHLGLRSIIESVGSNEFKRIRIGIGRPPHQGNVVSHVLGMSREDAEKLDAAVEIAVELALDFVDTGAFENFSAS